MKKLSTLLLAALMCLSVTITPVTFADNHENDGFTVKEQQLIEKFERVFTKFAEKQPDKVGTVLLRLELLLTRINEESKMYGLVSYLVEFVSDLPSEDGTNEDDMDDDEDDMDDDEDDMDDDEDDMDDDEDDMDDDEDDMDDDEDDMDDDEDDMDDDEDDMDDDEDDGDDDEDDMDDDDSSFMSSSSLKNRGKAYGKNK